MNNMKTLFLVDSFYKNSFSSVIVYFIHSNIIFCLTEDPNQGGSDIITAPLSQVQKPARPLVYSITDI